MEDLQKDYELTGTFSQSKDGNDPGDEYQYLYLKISDCGGGPYILMETKRWAIDFNEIDKFVELIKEFKEQYGRLQTDED